LFQDILNQPADFATLSVQRPQTGFIDLSISWMSSAVTGSVEGKFAFKSNIDNKETFE